MDELALPGPPSGLSRPPLHFSRSQLSISPRKASAWLRPLSPAPPQLFLPRDGPAYSARSAQPRAQVLRQNSGAHRSPQVRALTASPATLHRPSCRPPRSAPSVPVRLSVASAGLQGLRAPCRAHGLLCLGLAVGALCPQHRPVRSAQVPGRAARPAAHRMLRPATASVTPGRTVGLSAHVHDHGVVRASWVPRAILRHRAAFTKQVQDFGRASCAPSLTPGSPHPSPLSPLCGPMCP